MVKKFDKFLLFLYSIVVFCFVTWLFVTASAWIPIEITQSWVKRIYYEKAIAYPLLGVSVFLLLCSIRFLWAIIRSRHARGPSIDQSNEFGQIQITLETIEQIAVKAIQKFSGLSDIRTRIQVSDQGLSITIRVHVDGELAIPEVAVNIQTSVKSYVHEITGIPVAKVNVYIANLHQRSSSFQSRVE